MKTIHRKVYLGIACGIFSLLTLFSSSASAWQGQGDGVARKCGQYMNSTPIGTTIDYFWNSGAACAWSGLGWVYYKYVDGYSGTLTFVPSSSGQGGFKTISADCPKEGGFWHYGYFQGKSWWSDPSHSSGSFTAYMNGYGTVGNPGHGWGHDHAYPQENDLNLNKVQGNLYHQIYRDGSLAAYAAEAWPADDVKALYDNYLQRYPGESNLWGNGLSAFCDFQDHTDSYPKATNYDAEITAQQGARNGDYIAVNISARVSRPSGADFEVSNYYSLINSYDDNANSNWTNISLGQSTNYITQTVWVEMPEESSVRSISVCGYIYYYSSITIPYKDASPQRTGWTYKRACVTVNNTTSPPVNEDCPEMNINNTRYVGTTDAWMEFSSKAETKTLKSSGSHTFWAKPGDNFKYTYKMCGGSEYSRTYENKEPARGFGGADVQPKFKVTGEKNGSSNAGYLFGLSTSNPKTYTSGSDVKYYKSVSSPTSDTYKCEYTNGQSHIAGYYQVPAESGNTCESSKVAKYSDVGGSFDQKMEFRYVKTKRYEVYHHRTCGPAGARYDCSYYTYGTELDSSSDHTITGTVKVPYNYALAPYMKHGNSDGITYAGASFDTQAYIATIPRVNKQVQDTAYATRTKDTKIIVASFTMTGSALPISDGKSSTSGNLSSTTVCSVASGNKYDKDKCNVVYESTNVLNQTNDMLKGSSDESKTIENGGSSVSARISAAVPYVVPGTKFCVAVGVSPADSHNTGSNSIINNENQTVALSNSGTGYRVGPPACVTVAKKPTFSVESSQLVTNGNVKTSITNANSRVYGSWSEYGIVSAGNVTNMGSGAAYGYTSPYYNISATGFGVNKGTTGAGLPKSAKSACAYSPQTFGNASCSLGSASIIKSSVDSMAVAKKMYEIYHMSSSDMNDNYKLKYGIRDIAKATRYFGQANNRVAINGKSYVNFYAGSESACQYDAELGRYVAPTPTSTAYAFDENGNKVSTVYCTADGNKYMKVSGDAYYGGVNTLNYGGSGTSDLDHVNGVARTTYRNPVYVIDVDGTIIIDSNIHINNAGSDKFQAIDQIPTIIIFAKEVIISDNVTRLDAWIISGLNGGSGKINTCGYSHSAKALIATSDLTSDKCNSALYINGPVYATSAVLNRTFGGGGQSGDSEGTIKSRFAQRGEIINLRSDAYYWAYYQSQRNRILTTVYARELPARY